MITLTQAQIDEKERAEKTLKYIGGMKAGLKEVLSDDLGWSYTEETLLQDLEEEGEITNKVFAERTMLHKEYRKDDKAIAQSLLELLAGTEQEAQFVIEYLTGERECQLERM